MIEYAEQIIFELEGRKEKFESLEKDNRNYHIILIPRTNVARKKLNLASSHANTEGYYYKPRFFVSDLLDNFDDNDLYITTACVAGLLKDDDSIYKIFYPLYEKYGNNIMLEVQNHNADIPLLQSVEYYFLSTRMSYLNILCHSQYIILFSKEII